MQATSELYRNLLDTDHRKETRVAIGEIGKLITKQGDAITFGGTGILVGSSGADGGYGESLLISVETDSYLFTQDMPEVGCCICSRIRLEMIKPLGEIPRRARLVPYTRLTDGERYSEWIQKGVYYIDTRKKKEDGSGIEKIIIDGYDAMRMADQDYPHSELDWPAADLDVVKEIAQLMGVAVDARTEAIMKHGYRVQYPAGYTCREVLGYLAAMYAGSFIMSDLGELRLVLLNGIPEETRYLIASAGRPITFGGVRVLV